MGKLIVTLFSILLVLSFAQALYALTLDEARAKNLVVEQSDGYVKAVDASAKALADDVNSKRKQAYEEIAKKDKVDIKMVGEKAAQKIKEKLGK